MQRLDRLLYVLFAATLTLLTARAFYGYMLVQTQGEWSAPLDDVFIHFDYARATAAGHPFEWSHGNGYSSGNTSLLYPFVLAIGYWLGFHGNSLMIWAGVVACTSIFGLLLALPRSFDGPRWAKYLAPAALFCVGALDWSLFSGMEVAFFLGVWGGALSAALDLVALVNEASPPAGIDPPRVARGALVLGTWGVLLVLTRPEGATSLAALGIFAALAIRSKGGNPFAMLLRAGGPAAMALLAQSVANRSLTGEWSASGAVVKLSLYNPFMTFREKLDDYLFLLEYVVRRNTEHHFADTRPYGWLVPLFAAVPLLSRRTRATALLLWASSLSWLLVVALNAQVRWQNERYTMPAVAWMLLAAALGVSVLLDPGPERRLGFTSLGSWLLRAVPTVTLIALFYRHQASQMRDQIWFFGRASRNIRDQHLTAGKLLRRLAPVPHRVLVGDAGAIIYASDLPGLDLIGLGGYHDLPFARAGVHGLAATLELLERLPSHDLPDVMAIYPSWWGNLPIWFGREIADVPVRGNVICGGSDKVIYQADWSTLGRGADPRTLLPGESITDELDIADLVSESHHSYRFPRPGAGFTEAKILADPADPRSDFFDGGRRIPRERGETFELSLDPNRPARLIARTAQEHRAIVEIAVDGKVIGSWDLPPTDNWREVAMPLAAPNLGTRIHMTLTPRTEGDWVDYHLWLVQP